MNIGKEHDLDNTQKQYANNFSMVRIQRETYDKVVEFCNENDLVISATINKFLDYCVNNIEIREVPTTVEKIFIGNSEV